MAELPPFIGYSNQVDSAALSGSGWSTTYPLTNLQNRFLKKKARSTGTSATFDMDFGSSKTIGMVAVLSHNLTTSAMVRVYGSSVSNFASTVYDSTALTVYSGADYALSFTNVSARYWRITISDATNAAGYVQFGRVFIGPRFVPAVPVGFGFSTGAESESQVQKSLNGIEYFDIRPNRRSWKARWGFLTNAEAFTSWLGINRSHDVAGEVYLVIDPSANQGDRNFLGRLRTLSSIESPYVGNNETAVEISELL